MISTMFTRNVARRAVTATATRSTASTSRASAVISQLRFSSTVQKNKPDESSSWDESTSGWNETVATESEVAVKADHSENGDPEILQRKSVEHIRERLHHADDVTSGKVEAEYEREEVQGPLKHAMGNAEVKIEETVEKLKKGLK